MKIRYIKYWAFAAVLGMGTVSCEDFLNRPTEDNYNESNFYQNDEQCVQGVNYLYNSPMGHRTKRILRIERKEYQTY